MNHRLFFGNLDSLDLFQLFDAALYLFCLGGLSAEAVDERLQMLDLDALITVSGLELRPPLVFLAEVFGVVALIDIQALVPYLHRAIDRHIEKIPIVRDKDVTEGISPEIVLEPVTSFKIQVVGGLIEQQQIGLGQQQFGQCDAHLPASGKLIRLPRPILLAEAEPCEHATHLRVECVAVQRVKPLLLHGIALRSRFIFGASVIENSQLPGQMLDLLFHIAQLVKDCQALFKDTAPGEPQPLLRQVADAHATGLLHLAVVQRLKAGEHLHQRGFAGPIGAHQSGLFARPDQPVGFKKQYAGAKPLSGILQS